MSSDADEVHVLIVDDDRRIRELLRTFLAENGFRVSAAAGAAEAGELMRSLSFDLIVLDIMMPGESGLDFARRLRAQPNRVPIIVLSARGGTDDRIEGLTAGVDDYLPKPFDPRELLLRIRSILKRNAPSGGRNDDVRFGPYQFNTSRGELRREGQIVKLTTRERDMLRMLVRRAGETVSRGDLAQPGAEDGARSVDVQINRLRRKIEVDPSSPLYLQTVRGAGYTLHLD